MKETKKPTPIKGCYGPMINHDDFWCMKHGCPSMMCGSMENSLQRLLDWVEKEEYSWAGGNVVDSRSLIRKIKELKA